MEFLFLTNTGATSGGWVFNINQYAGTVYVDNVQLFQADVTLLDPTDNMKFIYNDTTAPVVNDLGGTWTGVTDNIIYTTYTLPPYSSKIFIK